MMPDHVTDPTDPSWDEWGREDPPVHEAPDGERFAPAHHSTYVEPDDNAPEGVVPLGYDRGVFFYLSRSARQVFALSATQHNKNNLMAMASLPHFWERSQFKAEKGGVRWDEATDWLMRECRAVGIYNPDIVRGRGAWLDQGRPVLHMGDHLIVGDARSGLRLPGSRHVYEAAQRFSDVVDVDPLSARKAHQLVTICRSLRWERGISGMLLAGFIAIAPVCGGLAWRPSIWVTGGKGSGKSWAEENVIAPAIGQMALRVLSVTTEPGIRRALGSDARPVLFDEAEQEDAASVTRFQAVLGLVRQSSSEGGGSILKADQGGGVARFRVRSCFAFSSINVGLVHGADESRITVLAFREPELDGTDARRADNEKFEQLAREVARTITPEFSAALLARSVRLLPVIRQNAETFARAVSIHLGSRRLGDQLGTLLAGAFSLHADRLVTMEEAEAFIKREEWEREVEQSDERDEQKLLARLTQARITFSPISGGSLTMAIGRLISCAAGFDNSVPNDTACRELLERGIRYWPGDGLKQPEGITFSSNHTELGRILKDTPWSAGWTNSLARLPGALRHPTSVRFGPGQPKSRGVFLPLALIEPGHKRSRTGAEAA